MHNLHCTFLSCTSTQPTFIKIFLALCTTNLLTAFSLELQSTFLENDLCLLSVKCPFSQHPCAFWLSASIFPSFASLGTGWPTGWLAHCWASVVLSAFCFFFGKALMTNIRLDCCLPCHFTVVAAVTDTVCLKNLTIIAH